MFAGNFYRLRLFCGLEEGRLQVLEENVAQQCHVLSNILEAEIVHDSRLFVVCEKSSFPLAFMYAAKSTTRINPKNFLPGISWIVFVRELRQVCCYAF